MNNSTSNSTVKPIPITLNCSGGISLGAYMAGVFYEITKEAVQDNPAIIIDTITGASAGAISGIMAAFYLLKPQKKAQDLLKEEKIKKNVFYQAWVEKTDIKEIDRLGFMPQKDEITGRNNWSIFAGDYIKNLAEELLKPDQVKIDENTKPLALVMTITNLQGLLKNFFNGDKIKAVTNAETRQFLFHSGLKNKSIEVEAMWEKVIIGGRASGAFPVAFPPVGDDSKLDSFNLSGCVDKYPRNIDDYREKTNNDSELKELENICRIKKDDRTGKDELKFIFSYTDGGVLDGLPILKGIDIDKRLISTKSFSSQEKELFSPKYIEKFEEFKTHWHKLKLDSNSRKYIYIQPQPVTNLKGAKSLLKRHFKMFQVGSKGLTLPKAGHDSQRLQDILEINDFAERREEFISKYRQELHSIFQEIKSQIEQKVENIELKTKLIQEYDRYNEKFIATLQAAEAEIKEAVPHIKVKLNRIDPSNIRQIPKLNNDDLNKIYQALENKLRKEKLEGENDELLASEFLGAFGGFFDQKYRKHDFLLGRISGLTWLHENCENIQTPIPKDEIVAQIQEEILESEPKLKPSHWARIARIVLRGMRIILIEFISIKSLFRIVGSLVAIILIPLLMTLEILLTLLIYLCESLEFVWQWLIAQS